MLSQSERETSTIPRSAEYSAPESRKRSQKGNEKVAASHRRMRFFYFGLTAGWGFLCGALGLAAVLSIHGHSIAVEDPLVLLLLIPALAVAVLGGALASAAYRDARRRSAR
jgi:hypothetical protein